MSDLARVLDKDKIVFRASWEELQSDRRLSRDFKTMRAAITHAAERVPAIIDVYEKLDDGSLFWRARLTVAWSGNRPK